MRALFVAGLLVAAPVLAQGGAEPTAAPAPLPDPADPGSVAAPSPDSAGDPAPAPDAVPAEAPAPGPASAASSGRTAAASPSAAPPPASAAMPRHEVTIPLALQVAGVYSDQLAAGVQYAFRFTEGFALQARYSRRLLSRPTLQMQLALNDPREDALPVGNEHGWSLLVGTELSPLRGSVVLGGGQELGLELVVTAGVGAVSLFTTTYDPVVPSTEPSEFDTGLRPGFSVAVGPRLKLGDHFALRLELNDLVFSQAIESVNGCSFDELDTMDTRRRMGQPHTGAEVSSGCRADSFGANGVELSTAASLSRFDNPPLLQLITVQLAASVMF